MRWLVAGLRSRFAKRWGALIGFATVLLFLSNPELLSFFLLVNVIGVDVLVLLVGIQLQQNWLAINTLVVGPLCSRVRRLLRPEHD